MEEGDCEGKRVWEPWKVTPHPWGPDHVTEALPGDEHGRGIAVTYSVFFLDEHVKISLVTTNWLCLCLSKAISGRPESQTWSGEEPWIKTTDTWIRQSPPAFVPGLSLAPSQQPLALKRATGSREADSSPNSGAPTWDLAKPISPGHGHERPPMITSVRLLNESFCQNSGKLWQAKGNLNFYVICYRDQSQTKSWRN